MPQEQGLLTEASDDALTIAAATMAAAYIAAHAETFRQRFRSVERVQHFASTYRWAIEMVHAAHRGRDEGLAPLAPPF